MYTKEFTGISMEETVEKAKYTVISSLHRGITDTAFTGTVTVDVEEKSNNS